MNVSRETIKKAPVPSSDDQHRGGFQTLDFILLLAVAAGMLFLSMSDQAQASERFYQEIWCARYLGETEVVLEDRTRVDCVTSTHAIEFDFAKKWAEAIGQSLGYADMTGKKPGIVLIVETQKDLKHWNKLNRVISNQCLIIDTWCIGDACEAGS